MGWLHGLPVLRRRFSCRDVVTAFVDRIEYANATHNAVVSLLHRAAPSKHGLQKSDATENAEPALC